MFRFSLLYQFPCGFPYRVQIFFNLTKNILRIARRKGATGIPFSGFNRVEADDTELQTASSPAPPKPGTHMTYRCTDTETRGLVPWTRV